MRYKLTLNMTAGVLAGALLLCTSPVMAEFGETTGRYGETTCVAGNPRGQLSSALDGFTLHYLLRRAADTNINRCREEIQIEVENDTITLYEQVVIKSTAGSGTQNSRLLVRGVDRTETGVEDHRVTLSASGLDADAIIASGKPKCAVLVEGNFITLQNINVTNVPAGFSGICVMGTETVLENVSVSGAASSGVGESCVQDAADEAQVEAGAEGEDAEASVAENTGGGACSNGGADGVKFCENAYRNVMVSPVSISNMAGCTINFGPKVDNQGWNSNRLIPVLPNSVANGLITVENALDTESELYSEIDEKIGLVFVPVDADNADNEQVDTDGVILREEMDIAESDFAGFANVTSSRANRLFSDSSDVRVCLSYKGDGRTTGTVEIRGLVLNGSNPDSPVASNVARLQIYTESGFAGYVVPAQQGYFGMYPSNQGGSDSGNDTTTGVFDIIMPTGHADIILVPEDSAHRLGSPAMVGSSPVIQAVSYVGPTERSTILPCLDRDFGGAGGGGGGGGGGSANGEYVRRMENPDRCTRVLRGIPNIGDEGGHKIRLSGRPFDTDGDGLTDDQEDSGYWDSEANAVKGAFNCRCDEGESCFLNADTDGDGILDGAGSKDAVDEYVRDGAQYVGGWGEFACVNQDSEGKCIKWMDNDRDGMVNAKDTDSDADGRTDTDEDRNAAIASIPGVVASITVGVDGQVGGGNGFLYELPRSTSGSSTATNQFATELVDGEEKIKECSLTSNSSPGSEYFYYVVDSATGDIVDQPGFPQKVVNYPPGLDTEAEGNSGKEIRVFACRSKAFASWDNFNGSYEDANNETNAYEEDASIVEEGSKPCRGGPDDNTVFYTTMFRSGDRYVMFTNGSPAWKPVSATDNRAKIFTQTLTEIASACYDIDTDGIPDCVEVPEGYGCTSVNTDLYWNNPDSDNDGHSDGFRVVGGMPQDVCPTSSGEGGMDTFSSDPAHRYSCGNKIQANQWYRDKDEKKRVAYFLDRDGDTIRDSEEDVNLNGSYDQSTRTSTPEDPITLEVLMTLESDALSLDSDNDGMSDQVERLRPIVADEGGRYTNPGNRDSDGDTLKDGDEDRNHNGSFDINIIERGNDLCIGAFDATGAYLLDTDPTNPDTDGDTLNDNVELNGEGFNVGQAFIDMVGNPQVWMSQQGGIPVRSNPRTTDSDGDTLLDNLEYNGDVVRSIESNPCMRDSDGDQVLDNDVRENIGSCRLSVGQLNCSRVTANAAGGVDTDGDRLPDWMEAQLGTDPNVRDTDGDTIEDGEEDADQDGIFEPLDGESNPALADTDGDGLTDQYEEEYGTEVNVPDTDGDGLLDGQEDANHNGRRDTTETDAKIADTDLDGLCDGSCRGVGEDLNLNGQRDVNENGSWAETDPTNPDSDFDGSSDWDEMTSGGGWNVSRNIGAATSGREGCSVVGSSGVAPTSIYYLFGVLLAATRLARRRLKRNCQIGENPLLK